MQPVDEEIYCKDDTLNLNLTRAHPSPLQRLFDQLFGTGVTGGQHTLVVGSLTNVTAKYLEDPWDSPLTRQLRGVVRCLQF